MSYTPPDPYIFMVEGGYATPDPWVFVSSGSGQEVRYPLRVALVQSWLLTGPVDPMVLIQQWALRLGVDLRQVWGDAPVVRGLLSQPWGDAGRLRAALVQRWRDAVVLRARLDQPWRIMAPIAGDLRQQWALTGDRVQGTLDQPWQVRDVEQLVAVLAQPWAIASDGEVLTYTVEVLAAGEPVRVSHVNIEADLDQDVLACEIHPETEAEYLRCPFGTPLTVTITSPEGSETVALVVTSPRIAEQHGDTQYIVEAMSPAALLGEPYADAVEGELSGLASAIAADLAGALPLDWRTVDWHIPPATWIAAGQTPLDLLKTLAAAVGARVQSAPDGIIVVAPEYPLSVPAWPTAAPAVELVEILDCFTAGSTPEHRNGYNRYLVGDQLSSADGLRLDETAISATVKEVRGYQVPWTGAVELIHTGGPWVGIESLGIEERQETETVEFVAGGGRTQYPIHGLVSAEWLHINLGTVTTAEDGSLTAAVSGQSLLSLTYRTRCRLWRVRDARSEQLQLVAEVPA